MLTRLTGAVSRGAHVTVLAFILLTAASAAAAVPGIGVIRLGETASIGASNLPKYATVILAPHKYSYIPQIKSASPEARVLVYKNPLSIVDCSNVDTCSAGVTLAQAQAHDAAYPSDPWILRDAAGNPVRNPGFSYFWLGNVGSASYRQQWVANVANTKRLGWDGVDMDDVLAQVSGWSKGVYPKLYPSDAAWESAMAGFMAYVGPQLKARGMYVLASAYKYGPADGSATAAWWRTVGPHVNGLMREYWVQNPNNLTQMYDTNPCCWTGNWLGWLSLADTAKSVGAHFFGLMRGSSTDTHMLQYGKASFLLVWDGAGSGFIFMPSDAVDPWNPAWTADIGTPLAPRYQVGVGWRRDYSAGVALVNPNGLSAQTFNLGGSYLTPSGATVTSVTLQPVNGMVLTKASTSVSAPANTSAPTISGTAQQGQTLSASAGSWSGSPTSYGYQWRRCDSAGANCAGITGATGSSYTLASVDVGKTIRVLVTATNAAGSTSASSAATAAVTASPLSAPANTSLPTISGTAQQGQTLSASAGSWSGSPTSYGYQWLRCDSAGANCAGITGATASSYTLASVDVGKTIRVLVTATNAAGSTSASSAATAAVTASPSAPANTSAPTISGTGQQGQTLSASAGSWSGSPTSYGYQWLRCDSAGANCAGITGATASSYTLASVDVGKTIRVLVTATNAAGSTSASSAATAVVTASPLSAPANTSLPTIFGTARHGQTLSASAGSWSGSPTSYAFQWLRCDSAGANCDGITGATASSYTLASADVGKTIRVLVTAVNAGGSAAAASNPTPVVLKRRSKNLTSIQEGKSKEFVRRARRLSELLDSVARLLDPGR